ncbi:uncharacterized protein LOC107980628 [Nasonia vitripennis]|uniref:Uncharacterized protein n=1 Tax=Nasonia vitripennis TaxID=7425 RepID=A0A7M7PY43_NASVI|nr:uncharacterized protein LOC107980628 [Nasonia vitripennis]
MLLQALEDFVATKFSNLSPAHRNEAIDDYKLCLRIKPRIGIFFTDGKYPASADCDNVPYEICKTHRWTRPVDCFYVAIEALAVNKNEDAIGGERNITAAVFLPELPAVNYAIAETSSHSIEQYFRSGGSLLTDIADKLFAKEADHTCFFIFLYQWQDEPTYENHHSNFLNMVLDGIKSRYAPGTYSLWGGAINDIFTIAKDENLPYQSTSFCAMGISGSSMMSWSIVIDHRMQQFEIEEKLQSFKINIHLQSSSIAFLILPTLRDNIDRSRLDIFKNIFPTITLMSIFNDKNNAVLSLDSMNFGIFSNF